MRYRPLIIDNRPYNQKPSLLILRDDGYRFHVRYVSGPDISVDRSEWLHVMDYKHCDIPRFSSAIADELMKDSYATEREAVASGCQRILGQTA